MNDPSVTIDVIKQVKPNCESEFESVLAESNDMPVIPFLKRTDLDVPYGAIADALAAAGSIELRSNSASQCKIKL
jgi:hypothetical protein